MQYFGEPGELSLYDATNGWLYLGFVSAFKIIEKAKTHSTIDRSLRRYDSEIKIMGVAIHGDAATLDDLRIREATAQSIYFCGLNSYGQVNNVYIIVEQKREDGTKPKLHTFTISAITNDPDNIIRVYNLLNGDGNFDIDTNSDGLADGWLQTGLTAKSIEASFLSGRGNAQRIKTTNAAGQIYYDIDCPFNDLRHFTFSVNILSDRAGLVPSYYRLQIQFRNKTTSVDIYNKSFSLDAANTDRSSYSLAYTPTQQITTVRVSVLYDTPGAAELVLDDAQLEINEVLTNYNDK